MSRSKAHSWGTIPFSWENKPGVSKVTQQECPTKGDFVLKLPPPPCPSSETARTNSVHDFQIPLPPCALHPPSRSSSKKGLRKQEDPFLAAYKECTKSIRNGKSVKDYVGFGFWKNMLDFSCKRSSSVRDDSLVRIFHLRENEEHHK